MLKTTNGKKKLYDYKIISLPHVGNEIIYENFQQINLNDLKIDELRSYIKKQILLINGFININKDKNYITKDISNIIKQFYFGQYYNFFNENSKYQSNITLFSLFSKNEKGFFSISKIDDLNAYFITIPKTFYNKNEYKKIDLPDPTDYAHTENKIDPFCLPQSISCLKNLISKNSYKELISFQDGDLSGFTISNGNWQVRYTLENQDSAICFQNKNGDQKLLYILSDLNKQYLEDYCLRFNKTYNDATWYVGIFDYDGINDKWIIIYRSVWKSDTDNNRNYLLEEIIICYNFNKN